MQERRNLYLGPDRCADRTLHGSLRRPFQRDRRDLLQIAEAVTPRRLAPASKLQINLVRRTVPSSLATVTLSRAAEMADLHMREMSLKLREQDVTLSYGPDELATDLQSF